MLLCCAAWTEKEEKALNDVMMARLNLEGDLCMHSIAKIQGSLLGNTGDHDTKTRGTLLLLLLLFDLA